jgi:uncharacterized protein YlxW (UPF0749 family)
MSKDQPTGPGMSKDQPTGSGMGKDQPAGSGASEDQPKRVFAPDFLTELFRNPLDQGYADAAARKAVEGEPTGLRKQVTTGVSSLVLAGLGFLFVVAYQQTVADEPARSKARDTLIEQVQNRRGETEQLQAKADALGDEVSALRDRELSGAAKARFDNLEAQTGLAPVRGHGAKVTVGDGPTPINPVTGERDTVARVKDTDLQLATNALWSLGAEAIAVNGQRLTATSTIRQAGEAILVDFRPVTTPYEVVAVGPDDLADDFDDGFAGRFFRELVAKYAMTYETAEVDEVTLAAATELKLRVAQPSTPPPAPSGSSSGSPPVTPNRISPSEGGR